MIHQQDNDFRLCKRSGERDEFHPALQRFRQNAYMGLNREHLQPGLGEQTGDFNRR